MNIFRSDFGISEEVVKGLDALGYTEPMPVQARVIKDIQNKQDLIVKSKTGSGKTAAFGIPIIDAIDTDSTMVQMLVLTPTRELAVQVCEELADIGKYKKIRTLPIYGKQPVHIQLRQLKQRVHVVVGTPGRILDLIKKKHLKVSEINYLVIDEADELLKRGFLDDVEAIIKKTASDRNTLLFSATMPDRIEEICSAYMVSPDRIEIENQGPAIDEIKQCYIEATDDWKFMRLKQIIDEKNPYTCMIFCNTRAKVDHLTDKLRVGKYSCASLHGNMAQKYRLRAISDFKSGKVQYLVCTDLAARGIHVDKLDLVINYNVPNELENYVHRIGRTGRAGESGEAITLVNEHESKRFQEIQDFIGYKVPLTTIESEKVNTKLGKTPSKGKKNSIEEKGYKTSGRRVKAQKKHKDIGMIRMNAGKKKKIRPGDVLGALSNLSGVNSDDIGIIDIQDTCTYIEVHNNKADVVVKGLSLSKVKGKNVTVKKIK